MSYYNTGRKQHHSGFRGGRGSRRGRGSFSFSDPVASPIEQDKDIMQGLVSVPLQTIAKPGEQDMSKISTENVKYIGSYNWTNRDKTTMIVPGSPPEWQNRATPYKVQPDVGVHYVDQNSFRSPSSVLLPLFTAVEALTHEAGESAVNWPEVDFVTDRNCLRNILRWIGNSDREFRIDMQLAGDKTVLLSRWSKRTRERFPGYTFGFNFEKAFTKPAPGCADTSGHHRIITYDMGGFKMVVRFEVDAFLPDPKKPASKAGSSTNVDDLITSLAAVNLSAEKLPAAKDVDKDEKSISAGLPGSLSTIKVTRGGSEIPQPSIVEMCTRSVARAVDFDWVDSYPQLFLSQTVHHFMGVHEKGLFTEVKHRSLHSSELKNIEEDLQPDFKKLVRALRIIQGIVKKHGERGRLSLVYKGKGLLELYERTSSDGCIPDDVMGLFE